MIYLDYAANTPADPAVLAAFCETEARFPANPNARHPMGRAARAELARITGSVAALLDVGPGDVIYTSGASESNNLAVKGLVQANPSGGRHILTTPLEHPSVRGALTWLEGQGYQVEELPLCPDGKVDLAQLPDLVREDTVLATVCAVDSETGVVQPIREMGELLRQFPGCRFHVDAVQAVGKLDLSFAGADTVSIAPHKFYGLNGSGLLLKRGCVPLAPQIHGGASATEARSGTPALALAAATETALSLALSHREERLGRVAALNTRLREALSRRPQVRINSPADASPYILNLSVRGVLGTVLQREMGKRGVCVSVRSACARNGEPSGAVMALTGDQRNALSSWRVSLSHLTTEAELDGFLQALDDCCRELGAG
ncbi:MAG: cysteine desulfurase [Clostridiales bacterium]|nr:cysteine desulfurase [Clostridiales bacterium]